jgi:hypothetical protein
MFVVPSVKFHVAGILFLLNEKYAAACNVSGVYMNETDCSLLHEALLKLL